MAANSVQAPLDCHGSWRPVPLFQPGEVFVCNFCGRKVGVASPPDNYLHDPWPGSKEYRVQAHGFVTKVPIVVVITFARSRRARGIPTTS